MTLLHHVLMPYRSYSRVFCLVFKKGEILRRVSAARCRGDLYARILKAHSHSMSGGSV